MLSMLTHLVKANVQLEPEGGFNYIGKLPHWRPPSWFRDKYYYTTSFTDYPRDILHKMLSIYYAYDFILGYPAYHFALVTWILEGGNIPWQEEHEYVNGYRTFFYRCHKNGLVPQSIWTLFEDIQKFGGSHCYY